MQEGIRHFSILLKDASQVLNVVIERYIIRTSVKCIESTKALGWAEFEKAEESFQNFNK